MPFRFYFNESYLRIKSNCKTGAWGRFFLKLRLVVICVHLSACTDPWSTRRYQPQKYLAVWVDLNRVLQTPPVSSIFHGQTEDRNFRTKLIGQFGNLKLLNLQASLYCFDSKRRWTAGQALSRSCRRAWRHCRLPAIHSWIIKKKKTIAKWDETIYRWCIGINCCIWRAW